MEQLSEAEFQVEIEEFTAWVEELSKTDNYIAATYRLLPVSDHLR